jgi:exonuclease III
LHLNVNSIFNKFEHIFSILDTQNIDILALSEAKLDENVPDKLYLHPNYTLKRRDRNIYGGGIMIYIKNCYKIVLFASNTDYEIVSFKLNINKIVNNFVYAYKPPSTRDADFLDHLDSVIKNLNLNNNLFIFGDLNMNWLNNYGEQLRNFCTYNGLSNFVLSPPHTVTSKCNSSTI